MLKEELEKLTDEIVDKVVQRIEDHIARVQYFYFLMVESGFIPEKYLQMKEIAEHDADKLEPKNLEGQALRYCVTEDDMTEEDFEIIDSVVGNHVKNNSHHLEYWGEGDHHTENMDCSEMPIPEIYVMMADWTATSEEKTGKSAKDWFKKAVVSEGGNRWNFSEEQLKVIRECLDFFEDKIDPDMKRNYGLEKSVDPVTVDVEKLEK